MDIPPVPDGWTSPIRYVIRYAPGILGSIAPERIDALKAVSKGLSLKFPDSSRHICNFNSESKIISVSRGVLEYLWCSSYAYFMLHEKYMASGLLGKQEPFDLQQDPELCDAMALLDWSLNVVASGVEHDWPSDLPRPIVSAAVGSWENLADELSLCALAFMMHHELAHHYLGHAGGSDVDAERDADYQATEWIMLGQEEDDDVFLKRCLGVAVALSGLTALGFRGGDWGGINHPRHYDRLLNCLDRVVSNDDHKIWVVVLMILKLYIDNSDVEVDESIEHDSARSCVDYYVETLSRLGQD